MEIVTVAVNSSPFSFSKSRSVDITVLCKDSCNALAFVA